MLVSLAIVTCQRPHSLLRLLRSLEQLETTASLEIVVVDNDPAHSARDILSSHATRHKLISVCEPQQGIPYARNAALRTCSAASDYIAFIDDDEVVAPSWLSQLLAVITATRADAVGGPVVPVYPPAAPPELIEGGFFARPNWPDGQKRRRLSTNNCLIRAATWRRQPVWFDERLRFTGSSDTLFFMMGRKLGWSLHWAAQACVYEHVPPQRLTATWIIQRQYRIGNGLALCDVLAYGYARALPLRLLKAGAFAMAGCCYALGGKRYRLKARAHWARAMGTLAALAGRYYEEYAPPRLIGDASC